MKIVEDLDGCDSVFLSSGDIMLAFNKMMMELDPKEGTVQMFCTPRFYRMLSGSSYTYCDGVTEFERFLYWENHKEDGYKLDNIMKISRDLYEDDDNPNVCDRLELRNGDKVVKSEPIYWA